MTAGCSGQGSEKKEETSKAEEASKETEAPSQEETQEEIDPETMDLIKYNIYVEMNNYMVEVLDNLDNYYLVVEYDDEFAFVPDSGYDYKFNIIYLNTDIIDDALAVASMEPAYDKLDDLAKEARCV